MQPLADNFLDAMEYANGPADSRYGKMRAAAGHPDPFGMKMLEIGNENVGREYEDRYAMIYPQIKAKYPDSLVLACFPQPRVKTEMADEHYYSSPSWFINNSTMYDKRDRNQPPVYIAEVAVTTPDAGPDRGNLRAALAESIFLLGCERNADVVRMVSYAPLLGNVDGRTPLAGAPPPWHAMIYFDSARCFGTASYYGWQMLSANRPSCTLATTVTSTGDDQPIAGGIGLGTWGTSAEFKDVKVEKDGQTLYASDFAKPAPEWKPAAGQWALTDGVFRQTRPEIGFAYVGDPTWTDYTLSLKARKLSGDEGFLIVFGRKADDNRF